MLVSALRYWRNSLADADLNAVKVPGNHLCAPHLWDAFLHGGVTDNAAKELIASANLSETRSNLRLRDIQIGDDVPVLLGLGRVKQEMLHGKEQRHSSDITSLWVPAAISRSGQLKPIPGIRPWIDRNFLSPNTTNKLVIGNVEDYDRYVTQKPCPDQPSQWVDYMLYASDLFATVTGHQLDTFAPEGFALLDPVLFPWDTSGGASTHLIWLYNYLLENPEATGSHLKSFVSSTEELAPQAVDGYAETIGRERWVASPDVTKPLSNSQLVALGASAQAQDQGRSQVVLGPPGTGKSALILNVILNAYTQAALDGKETPPLFITASNNRQAISSLLRMADSLRSEMGGPLGASWLPDEIQAGRGLCFLKTAIGGSEHLQCSNFHGKYVTGHVHTLFADGELHDRAEKLWLEACGNFFGVSRPLGLNEALEMLGHQMRMLKQDLDDHISGSPDEPEPEDLATIASIDEPDPIADIENQISDIARSVRERTAALRVVLDKRRNLRKHYMDLQQEKRLQERSVPELIRSMPLVAKHLENRAIKAFAARQPGLTSGHSYGDFLAKARATDKRHTAKEKALRAELATLRAQHAELKESMVVLEEQSNANCLSQTPAPRVTDISVEDLVTSDRAQQLRNDLFQLALRYFEGRWVQTIVNLSQSFMSQGLSTARRCFSSLAMLYPISVTTLHSAPAMFRTFSGTQGGDPLTDFFDQVIIDESGQALTCVAAPMLNYGRASLVVGDEKQLKPIEQISTGVDEGNRTEAGLPSDLLPGFSGKDGVFIKACYRLSLKTDEAIGERVFGIMLKEHWRCLPQIINFCNRLCYQGALKPMRPHPEVAPPIPQFSFGHVGYPSAIRMGSRYNIGEAYVIAAWLASYRKALESHYKADLSDIVAIITPFSAQQDEIRSAMHNHGELSDTTGMTVGTVHSLQGAERPVVLFSSVYSSQSEESMPFIESGENFLNVAVSRAQDSFVIFGDRNLYDRRSSSPTGLLARSCANQELPSVPVSLEALPTNRSTTALIQSYSASEGLSKAINQSLVQAVGREAILYCRELPRVDSELFTLLGKASERGVTVSVQAQLGEDVAPHRDAYPQVSIAVGASEPKLYDELEIAGHQVFVLQKGSDAEIARVTSFDANHYRRLLH